MSAKYNDPLPEEIGEDYRRCKLALLTGWTLEYIDGLGCLAESMIWQIHDVEMALLNESVQGTKRG